MVFLDLSAIRQSQRTEEEYPICDGHPHFLHLSFALVWFAQPSGVYGGFLYGCYLQCCFMTQHIQLSD